MKNKSIALHPLEDPTFAKWARTATVGERLRWLLEHRGFTQVQLAEEMRRLSKDDPKNLPKQSQAAQGQSAISNIITNYSRKPNAVTLLRMAAALQANAEWIMTGSGHPFEINTIGRKSERALLDAFRDMDEQAQSALLAAAKAMAKK
jgi:transcriptional regulator with XRE-family HTH domain